MFLARLFPKRLHALLLPWYRKWKRVEWHIRNVFRTYIASQRFPFDTTKPLPPSAALWLARCTEVLEKNGIRYALGWGTALGIVRGGNLIAHDTDMDISLIDVPDRSTIEPLMKSIGMALGRKVMTRPHMFGKKSVQQLVFYTPDCVNIDFLFWDTGEKGPLLHNFMDPDYIIEQPRRFFEELDNIMFNDKSYSIPKDITGYLTNLYGADWQTPRSFKNVDWRVGCKALVKRKS